MLENASPTPIDHAGPAESDIQRRRSLGIYYTPRSAAALLAKWAIRTPVDTVLEPSFGGCALLEAALNRLRSLGCAHPETQISGFDVDESAFTHLRKLLGKGRHKNFSLKDFLAVKPRALSVDVVIANPPFVSYHRMNEAQRAIIHDWRKSHAPSFPMTASLWAYFLEHSLSLLNIGGRIAFVLPLAALSSDYSHPLLDMLETKFSKLTVYRVREQLFIQAGAEERTVILLAEGYLEWVPNKCCRTENDVRNIHELDKVLQTAHSSLNSGRTSEATNSQDDPVRELLAREISLGRLMYLGQAISVKIGEVVGDTAFLVKSADEWSALGIPKRYLRPLITRTRQIPGIQVNKKELSSLYSPIPLLLSSEKLHPAKAVREYFDKYPLASRTGNYTFTKRSPWYAVSYESTASAFIGSMAHESPKIVWNSAGCSCANGLYKLSIRKGIKWGRLLAAVSLTTPFKLSAELHARVRGSGFLKLEPGDVSQLLIPALPPHLDAAATLKLLIQLDRLIRNEEYESATRLADNVFYPASGCYSAAELSILRNRLLDLRRQRLPAAKQPL